MKADSLSIKGIVLGVGMAAACISAGFIAFLFANTGRIDLALTALLYVVALCGLMGLALFLLRKKVALFTQKLCYTIDRMMDGEKETPRSFEKETLLSRVEHKLARLFAMTREREKALDDERQSLQEVISDISHQVKTPIANLKMLSGTLLEAKLPQEQQTHFLTTMDGQLDKLDFLLSSMIKMSRLEIGTLTFTKALTPIYETIAEALGAVFLSADKKQMRIEVNCDEGLYWLHDKKWTAEALFNILDNAVKYTPVGGRITINVSKMEMYIKIAVVDTGRGVAERHHSQIFKRFFREREVHNIEGIGIGLYLTRKIITLQGGYIMVQSSPGSGATFSVYLPSS
jgi:signal transduction histidine kinase